MQVRYFRISVSIEKPFNKAKGLKHLQNLIFNGSDKVLSFSYNTDLLYGSGSDELLLASLVCVDPYE